MKKLLLALGFVSACAPAHADMIQINVPCDPAPEVFKVMEQYKNALLLQGTGTISSKDGKNFTSGAQIFLNQDTGTLAFVLSFPNQDGPMMSCLIIAGAEWSHTEALSLGIRKKKIYNVDFIICLYVRC